MQTCKDERPMATTSQIFEDFHVTNNTCYAKELQLIHSCSGLFYPMLF